MNAGNQIRTSTERALVYLTETNPHTRAQARHMCVWREGPGVEEDLDELQSRWLDGRISEATIEESASQLIVLGAKTPPNQRASAYRMTSPEPDLLPTISWFWIVVVNEGFVRSMCKAANWQGLQHGIEAARSAFSVPAGEQGEYTVTCTRTLFEHNTVKVQGRYLGEALDRAIEAADEDFDNWDFNKRTGPTYCTSAAIGDHEYPEQGTLIEIPAEYGEKH